VDRAEGRPDMRELSGVDWFGGGGGKIILLSDGAHPRILIIGQSFSDDFSRTVLPSNQATSSLERPGKYKPFWER